MVNAPSNSYNWAGIGLKPKKTDGTFDHNVPVQPKYMIKYSKHDSKIEIDDSEFVRDGEPYETYRNHMEIELVEKYDGFRYSLEVLRKRGLKGNIQGPRRANGLLD